MDISYLGHSSFRIKTKSAVVVTDPFDPNMVGLKYSGISGDIVTVSHEHKDHNAFDKVIEVKKVVNNPGEYEIMGVSILGYNTYHDNTNGKDRGKNTIYLIEADGIRIAHLGDLGHILDEDLINELGDIDILMIPVGGVYTIGPKEASGIVSKIEPFFVIPMHYMAPGLKTDAFGDLQSVTEFIKESGLQEEKMDKFTIKREDIQEEQGTKIVVLSARN